MEHEKGPSERDKMKAQIRIPEQRSAVGYSDVEVGEGKDRIQLTAERPLRKEDVMVSLLMMVGQPTEKKTPEEEAPEKRNQETWSFWYSRCVAHRVQETDAGNQG